MKNKYRILKIFITIIILGFLLSFSLKRFNNKNLENISVKMKNTTPVYFVDERDIRDIVKTYNPGGRLGDVAIPELEQKIRSLPAVDSANVYLNLNGKLNIDIKQRIPVFRLTKGGKNFYVDEKGVEFPASKNYAHPCMLVSGNVPATDYPALVKLVNQIDADDFSKKYFIGISKNAENYNLLTVDGNYKVEIGDLENIGFKIKGFKAFVEKFLVYQDPAKYSKISVKYDNQIVTTLNPGFKANDSIISSATQELSKQPAAAVTKTPPKQHMQGTAEKPKVPEKLKDNKETPKKNVPAKTKEKPKPIKKKEAAKKAEAKPAGKKKEKK